jgi:hypothetical protein
MIIFEHDQIFVKLHMIEIKYKHPLARNPGIGIETKSSNTSMSGPTVRSPNFSLKTYYWRTRICRFTISTRRKQLSN